MTRLIGVCAAAIAATASVVSASGVSLDPAGKTLQQPKLEGTLPRVLANAKPTTLIPVIIRMKHQVSAEEIAGAIEGLDRFQARPVVIDLLRPLAEASQADLLTYLNAQANAGKADAVTPLWIANVIGAKLTPGVIKAVAARPDVEYVNYDMPVGKETLPVEPAGLGGGIAAIECGVNLMGAPKCWAEGITGKGVICTIVDTGCCVTHPDLKNQIWVNPGEIPGNGIDDDGNGFKDDINGWNFANNTNNVSDQSGHGTHTTGTVAGDGTNGQQTGMAPDVAMQICEYLDSIQSGQPSVWNSMQYSVANKGDIITASLGWLHSWNPDRKTWRQITDNCILAGVCVVFAAGNEGACCGVDSVRTPGDVPAMITVGATDCSDVIASFSSRGPVTWQNVPPYNDWPYPPGKIKPEICAPGVNTLSTSNNCSGYFSLSGTSMATPHVAGAIALMLEANPKLTHPQVLDILKKTAKDLGPQGEENTYGSGRVDAYAAMKMAQSLACYADFNGDGTLDIDDFIAFQTAYGLGDPDADCDESGGLDVDDFVCYQTEYGIGCP